MTKPRHYTEYPAQAVHDAGACGASIRWVITQHEGAENYALRVVELEPDGNSPHHDHWFEHENFVLEGEGTVTIGDQVFPIRPGDVIFVPAGTTHQYRNAGDKPLKFLCGIPMEWIREAKSGSSAGS